MSALAAVRKKFGTHISGAGKSSKSPSAQPLTPSAGSAGSQDTRFQLLDPALERRLRSHADRWQYSPGELTDLLEWARKDPSGWLWYVSRAEQWAELARQGAELAKSGLSDRAIANELHLDLGSTRNLLVINPEGNDIARLFLVQAS